MSTLSEKFARLEKTDLHKEPAYGMKLLRGILASTPAGLEILATANTLRLRTEFSGKVAPSAPAQLAGNTLFLSADVPAIVAPFALSAAILNTDLSRRGIPAEEQRAIFKEKQARLLSELARLSGPA